MTIPHYGVWVGQPTNYTAQTVQEDPKSPHIYLRFTDDSSSSKEPEAAINVKSTDKDSRLVWWLERNFTHPVTAQLANLAEGFHLLSSYAHSDNKRRYYNRSRHHGHHHSHGQSHGQSHDTESTIQGLDFLRTEGLVDISAGQILLTEGPKTDILQDLEPILDDAINQQATSYIFGSSYGSGIHDIHMNQGSLPSFENGIYSDGALLFHFKDGHWEAVFLAFASQKVPTDDNGEAEQGSKTLASIVGGPE